MTDPVIQDVELAAIPTAIADLQAIQQFEADMGPNPLLWVANYPGAKLRLLGALALQLPSLATSEGGALENVITTTTSGWITQLKAKQAAAASSAPAPSAAPATV